MKSVAFILFALESAAWASTGAENSTTSDNPIDNGEEHGHGEEGDHETHAVYAVLFPWFVQAIGIVVFFILTRYVHAIPYTAIMFIIGMFMGMGASQFGADDELSQSIRIWTGIDSETLFNVFLPGLLFKDALEINFHLFSECFWQLLWLAFPLVLIGTVLIALVGFYIFPFGWSWYQCLTFGCILSATDPVAVSALLNEVGAPPRLKIHVSGESLLNDGSAVVLFYVFGGLFLHELGIVALAEDSTIGEGFAVFFKMSLGGAGIGIAFAIALRFILYKLDRRMEKEETVLQVASTVTIAYLSFFVSEIVAGCSGVIAVVCTGIFTKAFAGGLISDWKVMDSFWSLLEHLLNTVIFALGGSVFGSIIIRDTWVGRDWGYLFVLYIFLNIIRFACLFGSYPLTSRIGLKTSIAETTFSSWGGLRGAVGITLALGLDELVYTYAEDVGDRKLTTEIFGMVGGIALLTLCINGPLAGPILIKLGLAESSESRKKIVEVAKDTTRRRILDDFLHLMTEDRFVFVDFAVVAYHCPLLRNLTADELQTAVEENRANVNPDLYKAPNLTYILPYIKGASRLRSSVAKTERDMFMAPVGLAESRKVLQDIYGDEERAISSEAEKPDERLLRETRLLFIELLRASYSSQVRDGELDPREFNGFLVYDLEQSVELSRDEVSDGKPLSDWNSTKRVSVDLFIQAESAAGRVQGACCARHKDFHTRVEGLVDVSTPLEYQRLRLDILRALSFIEAHKEAQDRLEDELGANKIGSFAAFKLVMKESKAEVRKAKGVLKAQSKKKLKHVISHYLCTIIQNKTARYITQLLDSGVLLQKEARELLEEIDEHIIAIRKCPLVDDHPGSLSPLDTEKADEYFHQSISKLYVDDTDHIPLEVVAGTDTTDSVQPAPDQPGLVRKRTRRKRVKQKSIL